MIQPVTLDLVRPGQASTAELHNQSKRALRRMNAAGLATQVIPQPRPEGGDEGAAIAKFVVANDARLSSAQRPGMRDDYFFAVKQGTAVDPETGNYSPDDLIKIAKPHKLQVTSWNGRTVYLTEFRTYVTYFYRNPDAPFTREATRRDEPLITENQYISPAYGTQRDPDRTDTSEDTIKAVQIGEEETGIDGIDWEDMNDSARAWSVLPAGFIE